MKFSRGGDPLDQEAESVANWTPAQRELVEVAPQDVLRMIAEQQVKLLDSVLTIIVEERGSRTMMTTHEFNNIYNRLLDMRQLQQEEWEAWNG